MARRTSDLRGSHGDDDPTRGYAVSYKAIRMWVGRLGFLLPTALFLLDWVFLRDGIVFRGSLSAYYYSGGRDVFVGVLSITGFMLILYMAGRGMDALDEREFRLSTIAGTAALLVGLVPTKRPGLLEGATLCGPDAEPVPEGCTRLQQLLGETAVATVHYVAAAIFILGLAAICLVIFAKREEQQAENAQSDEARSRHRNRKRTHRVCGGVILLGVSWILLGLVLEVRIFGWTHLLVGEVVSVYAFGASWMIRSYDLLPAPIAKGLGRIRVA